MLQFYPWEMCAILRMQQSRPFVWSTLEESNKKNREAVDSNTIWTR